MTGNSEYDFVAVEDALVRLQASSRRSVPLFLVGIVSTLIAAIVAGYFIFGLSSDLKEARHSLRQSRAALALAQSKLAEVQLLLNQERTTAHPQQQDQKIEAALSGLSSTQNTLNTASESISVATARLDTGAPGKVEKALLPLSDRGNFAGNWMDEYGTKYYISQNGKTFSYTLLFSANGNAFAGKANGTVNGKKASYIVSDDMKRKFSCTANLAANNIQIFEDCIDQHGSKSRVILTRY